MSNKRFQSFQTIVQRKKKKKGKNLFHFERPSEIEREERQRQKITSFVQISLIEARPNK